MSAGDAVDVLIAGAGPAGAAAARALARRGRRVLLCEAATLPRHRLCGEFVSPEAVADLTALDLDLAGCAPQHLQGAHIASGAVAVTTAFDAFAVARRVLDAWLAAAAVASGATLRTSCRVVEVNGDAAGGFTVTVSNADGAPATVRARWVIGAFGRRPLRLRPAARRAAAAGRVAVKSHWTRVAMPAQVELHVVPGGYVGLAPLAADRVNVCAVVRADRVRADGGGAVLARLLAAAPRAAARLAGGVEDGDARCAESGLRFGAVQPLWRDVLLAGDAAALPHPLAGDGIAMALRSGRLAAAYVDAALAGRIQARHLGAAYARAWRREFVSRLRWDAPLHAVLERPRIAASLLRVLGRWPRGLTALVEQTRGAATAAPILEVES